MDPKMQSEALIGKNFITYTIKITDRNGSFETSRRYRDFKLLR